MPTNIRCVHPWSHGAHGNSPLLLRSLHYRLVTSQTEREEGSGNAHAHKSLNACCFVPFGKLTSCMFSFGYFPGVRLRIYSSSSLWRWTWQRGPTRRKNLIWRRGNIPKRKHTRFRTRQKSEIMKFSSSSFFFQSHKSFLFCCLTLKMVTES
jgi:hypothetical protein